jgi:hypothetical protein
VTRDALETSFTAVKGFGMAGHEGQRGQFVVCAYLVALTVTLAGCSASELVQNWTPAPAPSTTISTDLSPPNYRQIVGDNIRAIFPNIETLGDLEISSVRPVDHLKGPAWLTCLKLDAHGKPQDYALFIQDNKIIDYRAGVVIDQCYKQTFELFDLATPAAKKAGP